MQSGVLGTLSNLIADMLFGYSPFHSLKICLRFVVSVLAEQPFLEEVRLVREYRNMWRFIFFLFFFIEAYKI